jgi:lysyl-tRNA synthetase class 2
VAHEGTETDLSRPFERITMADAFARWCGGLDILATGGDADRLRAEAMRIGVRPREGEGWEDLFFRLLLERVEPRLGRDRATFLTHWPAPQAALARRDPADPRAALRFELFAAGLELANAFDELTDPLEQRARFAHDVAERRRLYGADVCWPVDEDFLAALERGMPAGSGIALGFDRLAMLASGARRIEDVLWLPGAGLV